MPTLNDIDNLLESTIASIGKTIIQYVELQRYREDVMKNAKASEVARLNVPHFGPYINELKLQREVLETIRSHLKCCIEDNMKNEEKYYR